MESGNQKAEYLKDGEKYFMQMNKFTIKYVQLYRQKNQNTFKYQRNNPLERNFRKRAL